MKRVWACMCVVALTIVLGVITLHDVSAESISEIKGKITEFEKEQRRLEEERGHIGKDKQEVEEKIEDNINQQTNVTKEINSINEKLSTTLSSIQTKEMEIADTNDEIEALTAKVKKLKKDIKELQERIDKREELLKDRLISIQKNGGSVKYIEVIFGAQSFGDFISRTFAVNTIMDQDKDIMAEHEADKDLLKNKQNEVEEKRTEVEKQKVALEDQKAELVSLKSQLDKQMGEKESIMAQLEIEHEALEEYKMDIEEEQRVLNAQAKIIAQAKKDAQQKQGELEQLAEERRKQEAAAANGSQGNQSNAPTTDLTGGGSGALIWPASGRLSSGYGYRSFNGGGFHYGIDIANSTGTPVSAAAAGVVTRSDFSPSYGNVIFIYHPALNLTTVYAHLHTRSVSLGAEVTSGQGIGTIGNTGNSFGAHLHFETHRGAWQQHNAIDPMQFLK